MDTISFKRHRFPPEIIRRAVWLYARFTLSYRDVEDLLAARGLDISYESVRRWFLKFGAPIAQNLRHMRPIPNGYWHLDEMVIVIRGQRYWLWRAIDNGGEVLDFLVQSKRNAKAALKLMRKLLKKQGWTPTRITTDKLRSYHVAIRILGLTAQHIDNKRANNRAENSHQPVRRRERKQQRFKSPGWGIHLTQVATRCCGRAKASTKKRIPRLLLWRGVGLRSASDSRSCRPKAATAMNSRVGRLGGHSHDSRNLTFLFRSREATTHRVYLNEVDTPLTGFGPTLPEHPSRRLQYLLPPTSFMQ